MNVEIHKKLTKINTALADIRTVINKENAEIGTISTEVQALKDLDPFKHFYYGMTAPDPTQYKYWLQIDTTKENAPIKMVYDCVIQKRVTNISNSNTATIECRKPTRDIDMNATSIRYHLTKDYVVLDNTSSAGTLTTSITIRVSRRLPEEDGELFFNNKYIKDGNESTSYRLADLLTDLYVGSNNRFFLGSNEKYNDNKIYIFYPISEDVFKYVQIDLDNEMAVTELGRTTTASWLMWGTTNYCSYARGLIHIDASTFIIHVYPTTSNTSFCFMYEFTISNKVITKNTGSYDSEDLSKNSVSSNSRLTYLNNNFLLWDSADYTYNYPGGADRQTHGYDIRTKQFMWDATSSSPSTKLGTLLSNRGYSLVSNTSYSSNVRWFYSGDNLPTKYGVAEIQKTSGGASKGLVLFKYSYQYTSSKSQMNAKYAIEHIIAPTEYADGILANGSLYQNVYSYNPKTKTLKFIINTTPTIYTGTTSASSSISFPEDKKEIVLTFNTTGQESQMWLLDYESLTSVPSENNVIFNTMEPQCKLYINEDTYFCVYNSGSRVLFFYDNKQYQLKFSDGEKWTSVVSASDRNM